MSHKLADFPFIDLMDVAWLACLKGNKVEAVKAVQRSDPNLTHTTARTVVEAFMSLSSPGSPKANKLAMLVSEARVAQDRYGEKQWEIALVVREAAKRD